MVMVEILTDEDVVHRKYFCVNNLLVSLVELLLRQKKISCSVNLTMVMLKFWPWSGSKIFDHMTMTPGRRPYGQKIMVALPPPPDEL